MTLDELIIKLENIRYQVGGSVQVKTYSNDYCMDCHKIVDVTDGYFDGWHDHPDIVGICITQ